VKLFIQSAAENDILIQFEWYATKGLFDIARRFPAAVNEAVDPGNSSPGRRGAMDEGRSERGVAERVNIAARRGNDPPNLGNHRSLICPDCPVTIQDKLSDLSRVSRSRVPNGIALEGPTKLSALLIDTQSELRCFADNPIKRGASARGLLRCCAGTPRPLVQSRQFAR
jgi:hypothetical protein